MKIKMVSLLIPTVLIFCALPLLTTAQTVSTLVPSFPGNDGISIGPDGNLYVNVWGQNGIYNGKTVYKVTPEGEVSLFANNLSVFPSGSIFDLNGNLLITGWASGTITRIYQDGSNTLIVSGINGAGGLEVDPMNNIYISEYNNHRILKLDSLGNNPIVFSAASSINGPSGLTYVTATGDLYVGNWDDGRISVMAEDGTTSDFVTLPTPNVGTMMNHDGYIYATSPLHNKIYKINIEAKLVELFAGTGATGNLDGPADTATFNFPVGIATADGQTFYVSETYLGVGRLRVIENVAVDTDEVTTENRCSLFPNPSSSKLGVRCDSKNFDGLEMELYDVRGQLIQLLPNSAGSNWVELDIEGLPTGLYFLKVNNDTYSFVKE